MTFNKSSNNVIRYYVGSTGARRGGWWVRAIVRIAGNEADGNFAERNIPTKKEAKELCARLNEDLNDLSLDEVPVIDIPEVTSEEVIRISADSPFVGGPKSWAPEVIADNSGHWAGNGLRFATKAEAEANVQNLSDRWFLVRETRVVESTDEPNYRWVPGTGLVAIENLCPLCGERRGAAGTHKC